MNETTIDRAAFHTLSCGLYIVSSVDNEGRRCGCIINTLLQVTSKPPQLLIAINKDNCTTKAIEESGYFCTTVLSQNATMDLIGEFGFKSSYEVDKFARFTTNAGVHDIPYVVDDTVAVFSLKVVDRVDVGTHIVFIAAVEEARVLSDAEPLTYEYYHKVIKGGTPPKASSYDPTAESSSSSVSEISDTVCENNEPKVGWKCALCGTVIEGYPDGLPEDFKCPVCGVDREFFQKITI